MHQTCVCSHKPGPTSATSLRCIGTGLRSSSIPRNSQDLWIGVSCGLLITSGLVGMFERVCR
jgi:hypothetical protein